MFYLLVYRGLLLLSQVGLAVCSCIKILQIYGCKMIGGAELLVSGVDPELLLLAVVICIAIGGGSCHICYIVLI